MTTYSDRGFAQYAEFQDQYGALVKVVESSAATEACVWIFVDGGGTDSHGSAHLNHEQAVRVRDALSEWIDTHEALGL